MRTKHSNATVLTIYGPKESDSPLIKPVGEGEIRIIIAGTAGSGKTTIQQTLLNMLADLLPSTEVVAVNDDDEESVFAEGLRDVENHLAVISQANRVKKITLYTCPTSKRGRVRGVTVS